MQSKLLILVAFLTSMAIAAALVPTVRRLAVRVGAVDEPSARRVNARVMPRLGGLAMIAGFLAALLLSFGLDSLHGHPILSQVRLIVGLVAGSLIVGSLGVVDDVKNVGAKRKLAGQVLAASVAYAAGFRIPGVVLPLLGTVHFGPFAYFVTVVWIVGVVNAINLIDGLDGLASGVALCACVTNFVTGYVTMSTLGGSPEVCLLAACLGGSIVGFLFHNFYPASIFMGDSGSLFLGFVLAVIPLFGGGAHKGGTAIGILVPILALGLPITDMLLAVLRRALSRRSIFVADREHIHHRLLALGVTHRRAVLLLYGASVLFTVVSVTIYLGRSHQVGVALLMVIGVVVAVARTLKGARVLPPTTSPSDPPPAAEIDAAPAPAERSGPMRARTVTGD